MLVQIKYYATFLTRYLERILSGFLALIFILTLILVFLRYVLNQSITGANEIATILFIYTTAIGSAVSIQKDEHISIDIFTSIIPSKLYKAVKILQVSFVIALQFILLLFCLGWMQKAGGYLMPATGLPRIVVIASIPIGCLLSIFYCFLKLIGTQNNKSPDNKPEQNLDKRD